MPPLCGIEPTRCTVIRCRPLWANGWSGNCRSFWKTDTLHCFGFLIYRYAIRRHRAIVLWRGARSAHPWVPGWQGSVRAIRFRRTTAVRSAGIRNFSPAARSGPALTCRKRIVRVAVTRWRATDRTSHSNPASGFTGIKCRLLKSIFPASTLRREKPNGIWSPCLAKGG